MAESNFHTICITDKMQLFMLKESSRHAYVEKIKKKVQEVLVHTCLSIRLLCRQVWCYRSSSGFDHYIVMHATIVLVSVSDIRLRIKDK